MSLLARLLSKKAAAATTTLNQLRRTAAATAAASARGNQLRPLGVLSSSFSSASHDSSSSNNNDTKRAAGTRNDHVIIPGAVPHHYGSLGEGLSHGTRTSAQPWQANHNEEVQRVTRQAMIYELIHQQTATIEHVVPWFLTNMPKSYFQQVPVNYRMDHIKAIAAIKDANMDLYLNLKSHTHDGRTVLTFIRPGTAAGTLLKMVEELPAKPELDAPLTRLHVFSTLDSTMSLNMFVFGHSKQPPQSQEQKLQNLAEIAIPILEYAERIQSSGHAEPLLQPSPLLKRDSLLAYISNCRRTYVEIGAANPSRFLMQRMLFARVSGTEGTAVHIDQTETLQDEADAGRIWIDVAVANSMPQVALENLCQLLYHHKFDVARARLDVVPDGDNGSVTILRTLIAPISNINTYKNGQAAVPPETWLTLARELKRSKWLDPDTRELVFDKYPWLGVTRGEILTGFAALMHPVLAKENALAFSKANILDKISNARFIGHAAEIADLFLDRFNPDQPLSDAEMEERITRIVTAIDTNVEDTVATEILLKMMDIVRATLKTNVYMPERYALGMRLDPTIMETKDAPRSELPYGVVFVHGRRFNGFHVRFRDISRGGLRLVTPANGELYALESARHYDECYGLAFAQQLKNKDIPEGGSKAVNLINTADLPESVKNFVVRKSVKAFTDTILDLIVSTDETKAMIVDRLGRPEVLYLGPDEQIIPSDIEWIVKRAAYRGYETPAAFMSSKPRAGINHKEYGVTSEGVNVYLDTALRHVLKIDPNSRPFTVKMTGGPDGDVAGNEIKILIREYGDNVKIVGIADHSGCAEDPEGLDHDELLRLLKASLCISNFAETKLGSGGKLHLVETEEGVNPEGVKARNTMHNRITADAFIPCGGRPNTIDITNYKNFLKPDGTPSAPLIVEGANLFVTAEARKALYDEAGVVIVKDSSANKGGVITSSYEICAAMMLSEDEFVQYKEQIVAEVLEKLRGLAKMEAELMFREWENNGGSLPEISQVISNCINQMTDALVVALDSLSESERFSLFPLFRTHLPPTVANLAFDRIHDHVPAQYIKNAIASSLAAKIVYKEGTKFVACLPNKKLAAISLQYVEKEKEVAALMHALQDADMPEKDKQKIISLLDAGGARAALGVY